MSERKALATVEEKCETCRFWDEIDAHIKLGVCLRFPPVWTPHVSNADNSCHSNWKQPATIGEDGWCGEYQPKPVATPAPGV